MDSGSISGLSGVILGTIFSITTSVLVLPALLFSAQAAGQLFSLAPEVTRAKAAAQSVFSLHDEKGTIITATTDLYARPAATEDALLPGASPSYGTFSLKGDLEFRRVSLYYERRPDIAALNNVSKPDLFPGSVKFNIGLGTRPGATISDEDIMQVAKKCEMHDFIMSLPEGYNTEVGAHGSKLSGGQRQRLAIARALIRDPEILLLDEATSQLDASTENAIRKAIAAASKGRTTIMIAHRLASVQHADRIFVFDDGRVVAQGKHDELVAMGGIYTNMVAAQELD
ncbi:hypothetical protein N0V83_001711 [Neocucurbitaria cava]|uniref:ABC transporter domain-containing protein n=1 Tax=Neocucurbitaria cava TaxID=798079 RepID=A0A9W8YG44_9PLEO|nr:hypothetical protein N0V83_001711 [Neocucurbitaria cava]